jgi:hypothetical protein
MLPNFLGLGAQRCGTTWLFENLRIHPEVFMPERKEIGYFTEFCGGNLSKGLEWYTALFNRARHEKAVGEISAEYLLDPEAPSRIAETLRDPRFIVLVRNPIRRAFSSYARGIREGDWSCAFGEFLEGDVDYCRERGLYYRQIARYRRVFGPDAIYVGVYEDIEGDPRRFLASIYGFLGVDAGFESRHMHSKFNVGVTETDQVLSAVRQVRDAVYSVPVLRRLVKGLQRNRYVNRLVSGFLDSKKSEIDPLAVDCLAEYYMEDVENLSAYLKRDLVAEWFGFTGEVGAAR